MPEDLGCPARTIKRDVYATLFEIGTQIQAQEIDLDRVFATIVDKAAELANADVAWLAQLDEASQDITVVRAAGYRTRALLEMAVHLGEGLGGLALARHETVVVTDYATYPQITPPSVRTAVDGEGIASLVCAPMLRDDRMIGALYVATRHRTEFSPETRDLISALAAQAAIAIENSRLLARLETNNRLLEQKNWLLEQSSSIHHALTAATLRGGGIEDVAISLAQIVGRPVWVEQRLVPPFRAWFGGSETMPDAGGDALTLPITAGDAELGALSVDNVPPLGDLHRRALEHGATVLALELLRESARQDVEWRLGGDLLTALLRTPGSGDRRLLARAAQFGVDLGRPRRVVVLEALSDAPLALAEIQTAVSGLSRCSPAERSPILVASAGIDQVVVALPARPERLLSDFITAVQRRDRLRRCEAVMGVSRAGLDFAAAYKEATAGARFAKASGGERSVVHADEIGPMRFLFAVTDPAPLHAFIDDHLGPLLRSPRSNRDDLLATLRAYLESDGHHPTVAQACRIHKSTVKSRLGRIATILGRSLPDPGHRYELRLALSLLDFLEAVGQRHEH